MQNNITIFWPLSISWRIPNWWFSKSVSDPLRSRNGPGWSQTKMKIKMIGLREWWNSSELLKCCFDFPPSFRKQHQAKVKFVCKKLSITESFSSCYFLLLLLLLPPGPNRPLLLRLLLLFAMTQPGSHSEISLLFAAKIRFCFGSWCYCCCVEENHFPGTTTALAKWSL